MIYRLEILHSDCHHVAVRPSDSTPFCGSLMLYSSLLAVPLRLSPPIRDAGDDETNVKGGQKLSRHPKISIAMTTYNGERHLLEQLDSLASQESLPCELQIGDDGSTDGTKDIVSAFAASAPFPVTFCRNERRLGYGENFLQTAARCCGDWVAFCDQDDIWMPEKLSVVGSAIENSDELLLVVHNCTVVDETGVRLPNIVLSHFRDSSFPTLRLPATWSCAGFRQIFHRSIIENFDSSKRLGSIFRFKSETGIDSLPHDSWIPFIASMTGSVRSVAAPLVQYRRHLSNATIVSGNLQGADAFKNHSSEYRYVAKWHKSAADALIHAAEQPNDPKIQSARRRLQAENDWLLQRASLYETKSPTRRLAFLVRLISTGGYTLSWSMTLKSLVKDAIYTLVGNRLMMFSNMAR